MRVGAVVVWRAGPAVAEWPSTRSVAQSRQSARRVARGSRRAVGVRDVRRVRASGVRDACAAVDVVAVTDLLTGGAQVRRDLADQVAGTIELVFDQAPIGCVDRGLPSEQVVAVGGHVASTVDTLDKLAQRVMDVVRVEWWAASVHGPYVAAHVRPGRLGMAERVRHRVLEERCAEGRGDAGGRRVTPEIRVGCGDEATGG